MHVLPELAEAERTVDEVNLIGLRQVESHVYMLAMVGLAVLYGLERVVRGARPREEGGADAVSAGVFWLHASSFTVYSGLIGYPLVNRLEEDLAGAILFATAMALHFLTNDFGLRQDYQQVYERRARWMLAAGVLAGWALGETTAIHEAVTGLLFAFLGGATILNVMKEELPEDRRSRFSAFALGVAGYAALLLAL